MSETLIMVEVKGVIEHAIIRSFSGQDYTLGWF